MALICTKINEWIEEEVSKPIEEWEEKTEKKCKKRKWYDPRGWFCWLVTLLVKVVRWVLVKVGKWVVRTVCKVVVALLSLIVGVLSGLWDIIVGIFTLDWRRIVDGLIGIVSSAIDFVISIGRILFMADLIDYIVSEINKDILKDYVKELLENSYDGEELENIKKALRIDHGAFGLRINMTAIRTYLDSETTLGDREEIPNIINLHNDGQINLKELAGFEFNEGYFNRKRYKTIKKDSVIRGGGGLGEYDNPISEDELDKYISTGGLEGPKFIILSMRDKVLETKLDAASDKARELGLIPNWTSKDVEVIKKEHINHNGFDTGIASSSLVSFLIEKIERSDIRINPSEAMNELCNPVVVGIFRYTDGLRGLAACLKGSSCQDPHNASGATFIDNRIDLVWKYVPIHELGHYFGLCHTDGLDRIMLSSKQNKFLTWKTVPKMLYLKGLEPNFTLDEAKQAWDYIVEHFPRECYKD